MKKLLTFLLLAIGTVLCSADAAEQAAYAGTRAFVAELDRAGQPYTLDGPDEDGCEYVLLQSADAPFDYTVTVMFDANQENASLRVWYVIEYAPERYDEVMRVCNALNARSRFVCFYADDSDSTVTASMDLIFRGQDAGAVTWKAVRHLTGELNAAWPLLQACAVTAEANRNTPHLPVTSTPAPVRTTEPSREASATPEPVQSIEGHTIVITADSALVRSAPNAAGSYVGTAKPGERFACLGTANGWHAIDYHGRRAYVHTSKAELE